jgi:4'-phosphopantetheinyl transferase
LKERLDQFELPTIHVWTASLAASSKDLDQHRTVLSADELARAARFHFDVHRYRFVVGRGILRRLLSRYTGQDPAAIELFYGRHGKPRLHGYDLHFNLSHSEDRVVFAFTRIAPVGVDVECFRLIPEMTQIAESFFSPLEFKAMSAIPYPERNTAFLRCWTRKEAIIKASGAGLGCGRAGFDVSLEATAQVIVVNSDEAQQEFFLYDLGLSDEHIGALACRRPCDKVAIFQYSSSIDCVGTPDGCAETNL